MQDQYSWTVCKDVGSWARMLDVHGWSTYRLAQKAKELGAGVSTHELKKLSRDGLILEIQRCGGKRTTMSCWRAVVRGSIVSERVKVDAMGQAA